MLISKSRITLALLLAIGMLAATAGVATDPSLAAERPGKKKAEGALTAEEFEHFHQKLTKMSTEKVWSIPWQLSVRKARELAAKERKPVFLWISSNGGTHPLGPC